MEYRVRHPLTSEELNALFMNVWNEHNVTDLGSVIERSLTYVCAYEGEKLVGMLTSPGTAAITPS